jgi:Trypsin-co-occurring domain 2
MAKADNTVSLSALVAALRDEIDIMQDHLAASGKEALLKIDSAEVEISFGVEESTSAKGGISFKVFGIGFDGGGDTAAKNLVQQKLVLKLVPIADIGVAVAEE